MHEHEWEFDDSTPTLDTNPPIYTYVCKCGAVGQSTWSEDGKIVVLREGNEQVTS